MSCAAYCCAIDETFDRRVASREIERYRRKGPSPSTRQLLSAIRDAGIAGATVLDVGGGVGTIAHEHLLATSTERAGRRYGIVYPRDGWWLRVATAAQNALRRLRKTSFRVYVFPNAAIDTAIRRAGFALRRHERGLVWVVALYERSAAR